MTFWTKAYIGAGIVVVLFLAAWAYKHNYDNQRRLEGQLQFLTKDLTRRDSLHMAAISNLATQLNSQILTGTKVIEQWHTTTEKVPVYLPGRVDSVFKDSVFAALPDSEKVKILRELGSQVANACSVVMTTCQQFKDSAFVAFHVKDSLVTFWKKAVDLKARRPCGLGGSVGLGGGVGLTQRRLDAFLGGTVGLSCSF